MRAKLERFLEAATDFAVNMPRLAIALCVIGAILLASNIRGLKFDMTTEGLLVSDDPAIGVYEKFLDAYGRDEKILIAIRANEIFTPQTIAKIAKIHDRIENEVELISRVDSLANARDTRGENDTLIVGKLFDFPPATAEEWREIKTRALANAFYKNRLVSEDSKIAVIAARTLSRVQVGGEADDLEAFDDSASREKIPLTDEQNSEIVRKIREITLQEAEESYEIFLAGSPVVTDTLKKQMLADAALMIKLLVAAIAVLLFAFFRRFSGVFYPLLVIVFALVSMMGSVAISGMEVKLPMMIAPPFLLAIGVGACAHLLSIFYREFDGGKDRLDAIKTACRHSAFPIVMTSLTTIAGVASFVTAKIAPFILIGVFLPLGIFYALVLTLILLPALLAITPIKRREIAERNRRMDKVLIAFIDFSCTHPKKIAAVSAALLIVSIASLSQIKLSYYLMNWFPENDPIKIATNLLDDQIKGTVTAEILLDFGEENALYDPEIMRRLDRAIREAEQVKPIGTALGIPTIVKEINRALNENDDNFYTLPDSRGAIAEEILLFSNSGNDDLAEVANPDLSQTRVTLKMPLIDAIKGYPILREVKAIFERETRSGENGGAKVEVTGLLALMCQALTAAVISTAYSYGAAIFMIAAAMIFAFGWRLGLFAMIPNLTPIIIGMAFMVALKIPFDMFVMLVGSIVLGLAIDDTIHFIHNFRRYFAERGELRRALEGAMLSTGRAMTITSVVLTAGFSVYMFAYMRNFANFGIIAALCIALALLADFVLTPALLAIWFAKKK
ncbi:MAG: MMPL family transporter [Helicobacteraceae bacterium]|jgi:predicted RND superfamily exporter protein|nr:MMPL family transporter [Helicobacteraceae bacterium]